MLLFMDLKLASSRSLILKVMDTPGSRGFTVDFAFPFQQGVGIDGYSLKGPFLL